MTTQTAVSRSLSVVIPAFNEEQRLPPNLERLHGFLVEQGYDAEILVVDDGSRDRTRDTVEACRNRCPMLRVLSYGANRGKGFAVRTGVLAATRHAVLFTDADFSTPIGELDRLWEHLDRGFDVAIASRQMSDSQIEVRQPWYRRLVGRAFIVIVALIGVRGYRDTQCGFKLFRAEAVRRLFTPLRTHGFAFDVEVLMRARRLGMRVAEVPVRWLHSSDSRVRPVVDSVRMLVELLRMRGVL